MQTISPDFNGFLRTSTSADVFPAVFSFIFPLVCSLQSADFILHFTPSLRSPFWILPLVCSLHFTLSLLFPLLRSLQSAVLVLHWPYLYFLWAICICCERFVFDVNDLYLMWMISYLLWWICNLLWAIWICCEWFEFAVSDLNWMWVIWIWCAHFVLMWQLWATV